MLTGLNVASDVILHFSLVYPGTLLYFCKTKIIASRNFNPTQLSYSG
jgi:hypothetical protein